MIQGILGKKVGMTRWFDQDGDSHPVTVVHCQPNYIVQVKKNKIQLGYQKCKAKNLKKPRTVYLEKKKLPPLKYLKEVKSEDNGEYKVGEDVKVDIFEIGEKVDVQGTSKGKGFSGVVKRWGFKGGPAGRGSRMHRAPGSIGASSDPSRVWPGQKMAGRKGGSKVTISNLEIVDIDPNENFIMIKGAIPGPSESIVFVKRSVKESKSKK